MNTSQSQLFLLLLVGAVLGGTALYLIVRLAWTGNAAAQNLLKNAILIVVGASAFYVVVPKYHFFHEEVGKTGVYMFRANQITGKTELLSGPAWRSIEEVNKLLAQKAK